MKRFELFFAFILLPIDIAMILSAFALALIARTNMELAPLQLDIYMRYAALILPIWLLINAFNGLYYIKRGRGFFQEFLRIINANSAALLIFIVFIFLTHNSTISRLMIILSWIFSIATIALGRMLVKGAELAMLRWGIGRRQVLIIGDNSVVGEIIDHLTDKSFGVDVKGVLSEDGEKSSNGYRILGQFDNLTNTIKEYSIDEVVLADMSLSKRRTMEIIQICADNSVIFKYLPDMFSLMSLSFSQSSIGSMPAMELNSIPLEGWGRIIKRIIDLFFAFIFLIILSPVFLIISLLIKVTSKGPVIYANKRVGRDEKPFGFYKFRSMYLEKCDFTAGSKWTTKNDEVTRITPFGRILRKTNLDELPQLWNILKGDMSFVGPRPEFPKIVEKFEREIPEYFRRHRVKAGLTGWAQVNGLKGDTSIKERVRYDIYYIENWSLWLDIKIIFKTFWLVIYETFAGKYEYRTRS